MGELVEFLTPTREQACAISLDAFLKLRRAATLLQQQEAELAALRGVPVAELDDQRREAVHQAVAEALGSGAYDCRRVWEAWGYGTMGPDDFVPVAENGDRVAEIADAAIEAIRAIPAPAPVPVAASERLRQIGLQLRTQDNRCTANPIFTDNGMTGPLPLLPDHMVNYQPTNTEDQP